MKKVTFVFFAVLMLTGATYAQTVGGAELTPGLSKEHKHDANCNRFKEPVIRLIYQLQGVNSEQEAEQLKRVLGALDFILESQVHIATAKLHVTVKEAGYEYIIKDHVLSARSGMPPSFGLDFERALSVMPCK